MATTVGIHLLANVYDVDPALLEQLDIGLPMLHEIVKELDLHVVEKTGHQFTPFGYTYAFVLSESHFTIHTYPEHRSCFIDIFCCNKDFNSEYAIMCIMKHFKTKSITHQTITR